MTFTRKIRQRAAACCAALLLLCGALCPAALALTDGEYSVTLTMTGGSGKASVVSPTLLTLEDGAAYAQLEWSSTYYDYMIVDGEKYLNENDGGYSTFTIPVLVWDEPMTVLADTTAMGTPHEIEYELTFYSDSVDSKDALPQEAAKRVLAVAFAIILGGGVLNHFVNKRRAQDFTGTRKYQ